LPDIRPRQWNPSIAPEGEINRIGRFAALPPGFAAKPDVVFVLFYYKCLLQNFLGPVQTWSGPFVVSRGRSHESQGLFLGSLESGIIWNAKENRWRGCIAPEGNRQCCRRSDCKVVGGEPWAHWFQRFNQRQEGERSTSKDRRSTMEATEYLKQSSCLSNYGR